MGDIDGDGRPDLVVQSPDGLLHLYRGNGAGGVSSTETFSVPALGTLAGVLAQPGGFGDLLTATQDALVVIPNDGAGHF